MRLTGGRTALFSPASLGVACAALVSLLALAGCSDDGSGSTTTTDTSSTTSMTGGGGGNTGGSSTGGSSAGGGGAGGMSTGGQGGTFDPDAGWTDFSPLPDTQTIHVSSSMGDDANDGLSPEKPVKTIAKGKSLLRDGFPDHLLLRRGDVWNEAIGTWSKSGKGPGEPIVIAYYGDAPERPLLRTGAQNGFYAPDSSSLHDIAIIGIHLYAHTRDPGSPDFTGPAGQYGIRWLSQAENVLIEDVHIQFYKNTNITVQGVQGPVKNVVLRRSIITDAYSTDSHAQGIYAEKVDGLTIEQNVFDHNGWNADVSGAGKTQFNHNMYIHMSCNDLTVTDNVSVRASSHGLQARPGGVVKGNLFVDEPIGMSFGLVLGDSMPKPGGVTGEVSGNVILAGNDINPDVDSGARGIGIQIGNILQAAVHDNFILHDKSAKPYGKAFEITNNGIGLNDLTIEDNVVYDWRGNLQITTDAGYSNVLIKGNQIQSPEDMTRLVSLIGSNGYPPEITWQGNTWFSASPQDEWFSEKTSYQQFATDVGETGGAAEKRSYLDPDRTIAKYHESIGKEPDFYVWVAEARKQRKGNYRYEYTAAAPIAFLREGFHPAP